MKIYLSSFPTSKNVALSSINNKESFSSLIRSLNQDIVDNPERYANSTMDLIVKDKIAIQLGGIDAFERAHSRRLDIEKYGKFDWKGFNESLDFLNAELYDIIGEEKRLNESYEAIKRNISNIADENKKPLQDILDTQTQTVSSTISGLRAKNLQTVQTYQDKIYGLFKNTNQMDTFFGWNQVSSQTRVGFGEYFNVAFGNLSKEDIANIRIEARNYSSDIYAVNQTLNALDSYKPNLKTIKAASTKTYTNASDDVQKIIDTNIGTLNRTLNKTKVDEAAQAVKKEMQKKSTISGSFFDSAKDLAKKHLTAKGVGIAVASLAAIGIVNNAMHRQKNQSPLVPERRQGGANVPDTSMSPAQQGSMQQAPMSQKRVIYHDKSNGFNFRVSAKTKNYINDMNNAKLIGMSGGGQSSVYSQADTSGVTDNWLENKFAELT